MLALLAILVCTCAVSAQQSAYEQFSAHNAAMTAVQPAWMGPLIQPDSRLGQAVRLSVSNAHFPGAQTLNYGNNHGISVIGGTRFQFDIDPPSFFRNHSATLKDGFGNAATQVKYRIASGNAEHGNFAVTGILTRSFTPGSYQNGMYSGAFFPKLAAGRAFGRFNVQSTLGGVLPTSKIYLQGRAIEWNATAQVHPVANVWMDVENNATFNYGVFDGKTQNFVTPAAFYRVRRNNWSPTHPVVVFDAGMQIATSSFHIYNHNLITEMRMMF
jgi:hypothetical protein